jgi:hypothetical protein
MVIQPEETMAAAAVAVDLAQGEVTQAVGL